jgi:hypothetical protein
MLTIPDHEGNENQNRAKIPPHEKKGACWVFGVSSIADHLACCPSVCLCLISCEHLVSSLPLGVVFKLLISGIYKFL